MKNKENAAEDEKKKNPPKETNGKIEFLIAVEFRVWNIIIVFFLYVSVKMSWLPNE